MKRSKNKIWIPLLLGGIFCFYGWLTFTATHPILPSPENPLVFYSNQRRQDLKLTFCTALEKASHSISIQIYSLTDPSVKKILYEKEKQGICPRIFYDPSASPALDKMFSQAVPIHCKGLMHRKMIILDDEKIFLGTANLTTLSLQMHDNLVLGIYHPPLAHFLKNPSQSHGSFSIGKRKAEVWLLPDQTGEALNALINLVANAKEKIHVAMFTLTHPQLIEALKKAKQRGVEVKVAVDFYTGHGASLKSITALQEAEIPIYLSRGQQLLHHKWALIDDKKFIIGSANWTKAAFSRNQDCFIILYSLSHSQKRFLKKLWKTIELESKDML